MKRSALICMALAASFTFAGCDVDVADDGALPTVDVRGGNIPDVDVEGPTIGTETKTVEVPTIEPAAEGSANAEEGVE